MYDHTVTTTACYFILFIHSYMSIADLHLAIAMYCFDYCRSRLMQQASIMIILYLQFANPYDFQAKDATTNESTRIIFVLMTFGAIILMLALSPLMALYIHSVIAI